MKTTVLLLDDESRWLKMIKLALENRGIEVIVFDSGKALIEAIPQFQGRDDIKAALLDGHLYEEDGRSDQPYQGSDVALKLSQDLAEIKLIWISSTEIPNSVSDVVKDHIPKLGLITFPDQIMPKLLKVIGGI